MTESLAEGGLEPVAIIGMACRVPGASTPTELWRNLLTATESISRFSRAELLAAGVADSTLDENDYVAAGGYLDRADLFDADFFGFTAAEAEALDPQHRVLCETAWEAVEDSGHDPARLGGAVGVFAGTFLNKYLSSNLMANRRFARSAMAPVARMLNDKDFLATRIAYLLDLKGPAITVQTACSTSLVATHLACQALLSYDCDAAVVGGVSINLPLKSGYPVVAGGLFSPEGHCRPFDGQADGTVPGNGAVAVVLRRMSDAIADRDHIYAVIRGSAVNNDGNLKAGFAAPSVDGQLSVIASALSIAGVDPATIGYLEAHGTATRVGDPIEITALTQAFSGSAGRQRCALGSIKANIGHLDAGAGLAGLLRATLAVTHATIPPAANFETANPELALDRTPFYLPRQPIAWPDEVAPRRAGVSSFGVGGTNAHVVIEQAPRPGSRVGSARSWQFLPLSGRSADGVEQAAGKLSDHLQAVDVPLCDVAYTLQEGRRHFPFRRFVVCSDRAGAIGRLRGEGARPPVTKRALPECPEVVFAFPGAGMQHPNMGLDIYRSEPVFRDQVDLCARLAEPRLGFDLRRLLYPAAFEPLPGKGLVGGQATYGTTQGAGVVTALFAVEYALAQQLIAWGVTPSAMIGHSLGEYVAASLAGVFSLADALDLTLARGEIFAQMPPGKMLVIARPAAEVAAELPARLSISAVNAPGLTVVAGPDEDIDRYLRQLRDRDVDCRKVSVPVASHSWMVEPYLAEFVLQVKKLNPGTPRAPFVSGVTGGWITAEQATDPEYWADHLRKPVQFRDGLRTALGESGRVLLEIGPGQALAALAAAQQLKPAPVAISTMALPRDALPDLAHLINAAGQLWQAGVELDWHAFHQPAQPRRVPLPTYPFQQNRYWIEPDRPASVAAGGTAQAVAAEEPAAVEQPMTDGSECERQIARIWCDLLGLAEVGLDEDFFELGGHSLMVTQLTRQLRKTWTVQLSAGEILATPTIRAQADLVQHCLGDPGTRRPVAELRLADEARLDDTIQAGGLTLSTLAAPKVVLLTGATGFVGSFLCAELLQRTTASVICLVRAADQAGAVRRVRASLDRYGLTAADGSRVHAVTGDLAKPLFGLPETDFDRLAGQVDTVYHCGAWVNFIRPYRVLKPANVLGTEEVLRFACRRRLKPVHHVSTLAVLAGAMDGSTPVIYETDPLPPPIGHDTAYSQSKWVAERLIEIARERGIPVSIYRAGGVLAASGSGVTNVDDYVTKVIQGCVQLGLAPLRSYDLAVGTVDHLARLIVSLSLEPAVLGRTFHTVDPTPLPWNRVFAELRRFGYAVRSVDFAQWRAALIERVDQEGDDNALAPLLAMIGETPDRAAPLIDCAGVFDALPPAVAAATALDSDYFDRMLRYFVGQRLLPDPASCQPVR